MCLFIARWHQSWMYALWWMRSRPTFSQPSVGLRLRWCASITKKRCVVHGNCIFVALFLHTFALYRFHRTPLYCSALCKWTCYVLVSSFLCILYCAIHRLEHHAHRIAVCIHVSIAAFFYRYSIQLLNVLIRGV